MPPDYESQAYWTARFEHERHFEWLGDGSDTLIPVLRTHLPSLSQSPLPSHQPETAPAQTSPNLSRLRQARLLHIGAGTSSLPERLRELWRETYGPDTDERALVHTDFASALVARMRVAEAARTGAQGMRWVCADALKWDEARAVLVDIDDDSGASDSPGPTAPRLFDVVVEKSTSDAISCGEDVPLDGASESVHPILRTPTRAAIAPMELLAVHLAALVRPGGLWVALTFSASRFAFLDRGERSHADTARARPPDGSTYWSIEEVKPVNAPTGALEDTARVVHAPAVQHYVVLIRRNDVPLEL